MIRRLGITLLLIAAALPAGAQDAAPDTSAGVIDTEAAWENVSAARDLASSERHGEAAAVYLDALADDARLVPFVAHELAYQKLWREDAEKARFYFRRYLARHPDQENREVRKGLALATSWSGRQPEAVALYRDLVREDPADGEARIGLGRSLVWDNRLHEGFRVLRDVETGFGPDDRAAREAGAFLLTVLDGYTTHLDLRVEASWDSDELDITRIAPHGAVTVLGNKLLQIMPSAAFYRLPGQPDITAPRLGAGLVGALARNWSFHVYGWYENYSSKDPLFGGTDKLDWSRVGGDAWLTWLPVPRLRLDAGAASQAVETFYALDRHIHYEQASLSADWRLARRWSAGLSGSLADYSDGNRRTRGQASLKWRREGRWSVTAGPVVTAMSFDTPYPGGYWAPDQVHNGSLEATVSTRTGRTTLRLSGGIGLEKETDADTVTVGSVSGRVGRRLGANWLLAAEAGWSKSSFASASGYSRTALALSARALF
jgi:Flp pilus assembly protein TadD